jgi:hypothetical protein
MIADVDHIVAEFRGDSTLVDSAAFNPTGFASAQTNAHRCSTLSLQWLTRPLAREHA